MATMKRWTCPKCGVGKLAPSRPRRDDVRRYCLGCSEKTGRLVERACAALEGEKAAKQASRKVRAKKASARAKVVRAESREAFRARHTIGDVHLPDVVDRYWRVLVEEVRKAGGVVVAPERAPRLEVARSTKPHYYRGLGSRARAFIRLGPEVDKARACVFLLHELCHGACQNVREAAHGPVFRKTLRNAAMRLWGDAVGVTIPLHRYVLDDLIVVELRKVWGMPPGQIGWLDHAKRVKERRSARVAASAGPRADAPTGAPAGEPEAAAP